MSERFLFLDFDGVLNSLALWRRKKAAGLPIRGDDLDPEAVAHLNRLIDVSRAMVVVSSTWRLLHRRLELQRILEAYGFTGELVGQTPELQERQEDERFWRMIERGHEIQVWLSRNGVLSEQIVILDDDPEMAHLTPRLVQTSVDVGLTAQDVDKALALWGLGVEAKA